MGGIISKRPEKRGASWLEKKVFLFVFGVVMLFGSYVGWKLYQDSTRVIIPLEELQGITVSPI
ncbi:hypothetical protein RFF73_11385, partial [Streptococcus ruminantium]|nr:hypothetical protein [Streptococcus ruminantium]